MIKIKKGTLLILPTKFHNFWHTYIGNLQQADRPIVSPPNIVIVTALPCNIFNHNFTANNTQQMQKNMG